MPQSQKLHVVGEVLLNPGDPLQRLSRPGDYGPETRRGRWPAPIAKGRSREDLLPGRRPDCTEHRTDQQG